MQRRWVFALSLVLLVGTRPGFAAERSGVAVFPAGTNLDLLFLSAKELLEHEHYQIDTADPQTGRLVGSLRLFHTQNVGGSGGLLEEWRRWTILFAHGTNGEVRIEVGVASSHPVEAPYEIADQLQNLVAGKGVSSAKTSLTIDGVTKPLSEWKP